MIHQYDAFVADRQGAIVGRKLVQLYGFTPGLVTHDPHAAAYATQELHLEKGVLLEAAAKAK